VICIDSDVFLIDLRYPADPRARATKAFLNWAVETGRGATTIINLLEVTGVLSFNLSGQQLVDFYAHFPRRYNVRVLPSHGEGQRLPALRSAEILRVMLRKVAFGDAIIATLVNRLQSNVEGFVTWNTSHFVGRVTVPVFTPATFAHE
jgi:hypothetical protein